MGTPLYVAKPQTRGSKLACEGYLTADGKYGDCTGLFASKVERHPGRSHGNTTICRKQVVGQTVSLCCQEYRLANKFAPTRLLRLPKRLATIEFAIEKTRGADQGQVAQSLRGVAQVVAVAVELFGV